MPRARKTDPLQERSTNLKRKAAAPSKQIRQLEISPMKKPNMMTDSSPFMGFSDFALNSPVLKPSKPIYFNAMHAKEVKRPQDRRESSVASKTEEKVGPNPKLFNPVPANQNKRPQGQKETNVSSKTEENESKKAFYNPVPAKENKRPKDQRETTVSSKTEEKVGAKNQLFSRKPQPGSQVSIFTDKSDDSEPVKKIIGKKIEKSPSPSPEEMPVKKTYAKKAEIEKSSSQLPEEIPAKKTHGKKTEKEKSSSLLPEKMPARKTYGRKAEKSPSPEELPAKKTYGKKAEKSALPEENPNKKTQENITERSPLPEETPQNRTLNVSMVNSVLNGSQIPSMDAMRSILDNFFEAYKSKIEKKQESDQKTVKKVIGQGEQEIKEMFAQAHTTRHALHKKMYSETVSIMKHAFKELKKIENENVKLDEFLAARNTEIATSRSRVEKIVEATMEIMKQYSQDIGSTEEFEKEKLAEIEKIVIGRVRDLQKNRSKSQSHDEMLKDTLCKLFDS